MSHQFGPLAPPLMKLLNERRNVCNLFLVLSWCMWSSDQVWRTEVMPWRREHSGFTHPSSAVWQRQGGSTSQTSQATLGEDSSVLKCTL